MNAKIYLFIWIIAFISPLDAYSVSDQSYGDMEEVFYLDNHDGDTIRFNIPAVHPLIGEKISVRVRGIDTPELRGKCPKEKQMAKEAKEMLENILKKARKITLKETGRDKYFRIVAHVEADGVDVNLVLFNSGLAVPYEGGTKNRDWCASGVDH